MENIIMNGNENLNPESIKFFQSYYDEYYKPKNGIIPEKNLFAPKGRDAMIEILLKKGIIKA